MDTPYGMAFHRRNQMGPNWLNYDSSTTECMTEEEVQYIENVRRNHREEVYCGCPPPTHVRLANYFLMDQLYKDYRFSPVPRGSHYTGFFNANVPPNHIYRAPKRQCENSFDHGFTEDMFSPAFSRTRARHVNDVSSRTAQAGNYRETNSKFAAPLASFGLYRNPSVSFWNETSFSSTQRKLRKLWNGCPGPVRVPHSVATDPARYRNGPGSFVSSPTSNVVSNRGHGGTKSPPFIGSRTFRYESSSMNSSSSQRSERNFQLPRDRTEAAARSNVVSMDGDLVGKQLDDLHVCNRSEFCTVHASSKDSIVPQECSLLQELLSARTQERTSEPELSPYLLPRNTERHGCAPSSADVRRTTFCKPNRSPEVITRFQLLNEGAVQDSVFPVGVSVTPDQHAHDTGLIVARHPANSTHTCSLSCARSSETLPISNSGAVQREVSSAVGASVHGQQTNDSDSEDVQYCGTRNSTVTCSRKLAPSIVDGFLAPLMSLANANLMQLPRKTLHSLGDGDTKTETLSHVVLDTPSSGESDTDSVTMQTTFSEETKATALMKASSLHQGSTACRELALTDDHPKPPEELYLEILGSEPSEVQKCRCFDAKVNATDVTSLSVTSTFRCSTTLWEVPSFEDNQATHFSERTVELISGGSPEQEISFHVLPTILSRCEDDNGYVASPSVLSFPIEVDYNVSASSSPYDVQTLLREQSPSSSHYFMTQSTDSSRRRSCNETGKPGILKSADLAATGYSSTESNINHHYADPDERDIASQKPITPEKESANLGSINDCTEIIPDRVSAPAPFRYQVYYKPTTNQSTILRKFDASNEDKNVISILKDSIRQQKVSSFKMPSSDGSHGTASGETTESRKTCYVDSEVTSYHPTKSELRGKRDPSRRNASSFPERKRVKPYSTSAADPVLYQNGNDGGRDSYGSTAIRPQVLQKPDTSYEDVHVVHLLRSSPITQKELSSKKQHCNRKRKISITETAKPKAVYNSDPEVIDCLITEPTNRDHADPIETNLAAIRERKCAKSHVSPESPVRNRGENVDDFAKLSKISWKMNKNRERISLIRPVRDHPQKQVEFPSNSKNSDRSPEISSSGKAKTVVCSADSTDANYLTAKSIINHDTDSRKTNTAPPSLTEKKFVKPHIVSAVAPVRNRNDNVILIRPKMFRKTNGTSNTRKYEVPTASGSPIQQKESVSTESYKVQRHIKKFRLLADRKPTSKPE